MKQTQANIQIDVDLTNPGQFFACCGLLELANRLCPGAEGWFEGNVFQLSVDATFPGIIDALRRSVVTNTMTQEQKERLEKLSAMSKKERDSLGLEDEKKVLDALRRELPIVFKTPLDLTIDWFSEFSDGSIFKTWAGQQSVLDITVAMHTGLVVVDASETSTVWSSKSGIGLPFNFDSDLGGQGSALDVGFSFDPLAGSELTRIQVGCRPALELLSFIGLQRFRPSGIPRQNRYVYAVWHTPLPPNVAAAAACRAVHVGTAIEYEFRLLYRTKYLKSFLPAIPFKGEDNE